jgi:hypothetical protein
MYGFKKDYTYGRVRESAHIAAKLIAREPKRDTSPAGAKAEWDRATTNLLAPKKNVAVSASDKLSPAERVVARMHASAEKPKRSGMGLVIAASKSAARFVTFRAVASESARR